MTFYRPTYMAKARRTPKRQNPKQTRFENSMAVEANSHVRAALESLKNVTTRAEVERLYRAGKAKDISKLFKPSSTKDFFTNVADILGEAVKGGEKLSIKGIRPGAANQAQLGLTNDAISEYVSTRTGALIRGVTEDMQVVVQDSVRVGLASGQNPQQIADAIMDGVGLDPVRARAVASYAGPDKPAFAETMTDTRAMLIARTEVSFAVNHGQVATWQAAVDDGMLGADSKKVWITDPNPCLKICEPMDGVEVGLEETFILPDGVEVIAPPAHPNCRCQTGILEDGGTKPSSGRERDDGEGSEDDAEDA